MAETVSWAPDCLVNREQWAVSIHYTWLISITAALYLVVRCWIRHSAIRMAAEEP